MSLFQERYKLYYRKMVAQLRINKKKYISFKIVPSILSVLCACNKKLWRVRATIVAAETQQCILCVVEIHFAVKHVNIFYVAQ